MGRPQRDLDLHCEAEYKRLLPSHTPAHVLSVRMLDYRQAPTRLADSGI